MIIGIKVILVSIIILLGNLILVVVLDLSALLCFLGDLTEERMRVVEWLSLTDKTSRGLCKILTFAPNRDPFLKKCERLVAERG